MYLIHLNITFVTEIQNDLNLSFCAIFPCNICIRIRLIGLYVTDGVTHTVGTSLVGAKISEDTSKKEIFLIIYS